MSSVRLTGGRCWHRGHPRLADLPEHGAPMSGENVRPDDLAVRPRSRHGRGPLDGGRPDRLLRPMALHAQPGHPRAAISARTTTPVPAWRWCGRQRAPRHAASRMPSLRADGPPTSRGHEPSRCPIRPPSSATVLGATRTVRAGASVLRRDARRRRHRRPPRGPEPAPARGRHARRGPAADPRRRRLGQDARAHAPDRLPAPHRPGARRRDPRDHLHQQGRAGDARARRAAGRPRARARCG